MSANLNPDGTLTITTMSLIELLPEVEKAIHLGFMLDVDTNLGTPQQLGTLLTVTMFPAGAVQVQDIDSDESFVITPETNIAEVTQPASAEAEKALESSIQDEAVSTPQVEVPVQTPAPKVDGRRKKS